MQAILTAKRVGEILENIKNVRVAVYGDFCLDAYWMLDTGGGEQSVETGLQARAVRKQRYALGGAGNVAANLAAMNPTQVCVIGAMGDDVFGRELKRQLDALGIDTSGLIAQADGFDTVTFGKPYLDSREQERMDFGFFNQPTRQTQTQLLAALRTAMVDIDVLIINQQVPGNDDTVRFFQSVNELLEDFAPKPAILDSRHYGKLFGHVIRKLNAVEAAQLNGIDAHSSDVITLSDAQRYAQALYRQSGKPVFVTRGERGMLVADTDGVTEVPGLMLTGKRDPVGAGDTTIAAIALCLAAGVSAAQAGQLANTAAAVTVQKCFQTGTASPQEILDMADNAYPVYQPELAEDIRQATYLDHSELEYCHSAPPGARSIRHAVFDHDGTISTLRQGWEQVMEPMMIRAILGGAYAGADETLYHKVRTAVLETIEQSTGVQTIIQMDMLVAMVRDFGLVPRENILDAAGYKAIYNQALMERVTQRVAKLKRGELDVSDFTIKGAVSFLRTLRDRGVTLYLASGTDRQDVVDEAAVLGYADLFNGGIYGSVGDVSKYSKKMVIENIMTDHKLSGNDLAVFGDGPVEIRQCRRRDGFAVGIAGDEVRRYGLDTEKRSRLIKAGADVIIPDFSQTSILLGHLLGGA